VFRGEQGVDDGARVAAFEPAVGGDGAAAGAVGADVHHDDAVAGAQQEFRRSNDSDAVVGNAVEKEDPAAVGVFRAGFPATERGTIRCANVKILAGCAGDGEGSVGLTDYIGSQVAANGMEERWAGEPSGHSRQERREEQ